MHINGEMVERRRQDRQIAMSPAYSGHRKSIFVLPDGIFPGGKAKHSLSKPFEGRKAARAEPSIGFLAPFPRTSDG